MNIFILYTEGTTKVDLLSVSNKIGVLDDVCIYANVYRCLDSNDMLTLKILCSEENNIYKQVREKQIIMTYINGRYTPYVICSLEKDLDEINIVCRQWTIETTKSMFIKDAKPRDLNGLAMLDWLKTHCEEYGIRQYATDLEVGSNISTLGSSNFYYIKMDECINQLSELYGAEINRDGFKVELVDFRGSKTPKYTIEYGQNLLSNTQFERYDYATGCYASGFDGIKSPIVYSGKLASNKNLLGQTIEIQTKVRVRSGNTEDDGNYLYFNTEEEAIQELTKIAKERMEKGGIDEPLVEFETKFIDLALTEEYKEIISKTFLEVGDTVRVKINKYNNLDINVRVYEWNFNPLTQEIGDVTLTNNDIKSMTPPTISSISKEVAKKPSINETIEISKKQSVEYIMGGFGGSNHYNPNFMAATDKPRIEDANEGLLLNYRGIVGFEGGINPITGEVGKVNVAIDLKGRINASQILTGELDCSLLKTGTIRNHSGSIEINMEGEGVDFKNNGHKAISIKRNLLEFYDWEGTERTQRVGSIFSSRRQSDPNRCGTTMSHEAGTHMSLCYYSDTTKFHEPYIDFDKFNKITGLNPITVRENMGIADKSSIFFGNDNQHELYNDISNKFTLAYRNGLFMYDRDKSKTMVEINANKTWPINLWAKTNIDGELYVNGNIYSNNLSRSATMALGEESNEQYRLITKGEMMVEIEQLKAEIKELKALIIKH